MASIWSAVAGAAQGFSAVKQREYEEKLKAQEEANAEARALRMQRAKMEMDRQERAGSVLGAPTRNTVTGQIEGFVYGPDGKSIEQRSFGSLPPEEVELFRAQREREVQKEELGLKGLLARIEKDETAADKNRRWQPSRGSSGGSRGLTAGQERKAEQDFIEESLEDQGFFKRNGRWMQAAPLTQKEGGVEFITGAIDPEKVVPVTSETISRIRKQARDQYRGILAPDDEPVETSRPDWATEGAEVIGPDGKTYVIRNGVPVLKG